MKQEELKIATNLILIDKENNKVLGVSRKNNHHDFGLIGGKLNKGETPIEAGIREAKEETGLDVENFILIDNSYADFGYEVFTYMVDYSGEIYTDEPHVVKWCNPIELTTGTFGEYNKMIFEKLKLLY